MFNPLAFITNLKFMGVGMLTIVAVMGAIILMTMLLNKMYKD
ncbi:MAG: oxaloacetate decarboxylase [Clostridia bacterium]|nr:oxaloacetate decarboxylase [Clostridia bacterium]